MYVIIVIIIIIIIIIIIVITIIVIIIMIVGGPMRGGRGRRGGGAAAAWGRSAGWPLALMEAGADRSEALAEMGGDRNVPVLYNLTQLLKQGSRLGGGITSGIEQIINEGQNIEKNRIKEDVNRVGAKMTIVMMVFMLPALFIIIGGPAIVSIGQALSR